MFSRVLTVFVVVTLFAGAALAEEAHPAGAHAPVHLEKQDWPFKGAFGTYDRAALKRGFEVYRQVCASCHSMDRLYYRNLTEIGYSPSEVKEIAAEYMVMDAPNEEGEILERKATPGDHFKAPFANRQAAMYANNGAAPPDMSLLVKARHGGADYIYGIITGYAEPPVDVTLRQGQYWNKVMAGHVIAMAPPLTDGQVSYADGTEGTVPQYAKDVAQFLAWASEPHLEARKRTGVKAFIFLLVFTMVMYSAKKRIWKNVH